MRQPKNLRDKLKIIFGPPATKCGHDRDHWCNLCFRAPEPVEYTLPNGKRLKGYIISNL